MGLDIFDIKICKSPAAIKDEKIKLMTPGPVQTAENVMEARSRALQIQI